MALYNAVVLMVRVLAYTHSTVGALLIIFGVADGLTPISVDMYTTFSRQIIFVAWIGTLVSVHCRNSAFVRYVKINIFLAFGAVLFSRLSTRWLVAVKIDEKIKSKSEYNRYHFPQLKAFGGVRVRMQWTLFLLNQMQMFLKVILTKFLLKAQGFFTVALALRISLGTSLIKPFYSVE